jgi:carboxymethylenebutenolidase
MDDAGSGPVTRTEIVIDTADGRCRATLHTPDGAEPRPGVLYYPDAGGVRETFAAMADRVAGWGRAVLVPDIYYRTPYAPFDTTTLFGDEQEFGRLRELAAGLTVPMIVRDAGAYLDALVERAAGPRVATAGYCFGGGMALRAAAHHPDRVVAAASFHGGNLAVADDPDSPHLLADRIRAAVYVAAAQDDAVFGPDQHERLGQALEAAGVSHTIETYAAAHGFAVPDNPTHDAAADRRHRAALAALLGSAPAT